jgi:hypothetical protein
VGVGEERTVREDLARPSVGETARDRKFRQAGFAYLHVGILYEAAAWVMAQRGELPDRFGPPAVWLLAGAAVVALIFWLLYFKRSVWTARLVWATHALRLPALIGGAFFPAEATRFAPGFYITALIVVVINLVFLARAGWDL